MSEAEFDETAEADDGERHPRGRTALVGLEEPARAFEDALSRGRLHHAWLIYGPKGVGKASFAYRAARRLLGAEPRSEFGPLGADPDDRIFRLIASKSHPDLMALEPAKRDIAVDEARRLPEFFAKSPALGGYRIAIVDAAEDLNPSGANALLKTLEEPSSRGALFLVSHAPGRLLPTIRSRCRLLRFRPWTDQAVAALLEKEGVEANRAAALAGLARGSPGRAKMLSGPLLHEVDELLGPLLEGAGASDLASSHRFAGQLRGSSGGPRLRLFLERAADEAADRARAAPAPSAERWARLYEWLSALPTRTEALNLDRVDVFWTAVSRLGEAKGLTC